MAERGQRRLALDQLAHLRQVAVRGADHFLGERGILPGEPVADRRRLGRVPGDDWRRQGDQTQGGELDERAARQTLSHRDLRVSGPAMLRSGPRPAASAIFSEETSRAPSPWRSAAYGRWSGRRRADQVGA